MGMLFFPTPYPDELLYSVIARYHAMTVCSHGATLADLFGTEKATVGIDFVTRLRTLCERLPSGLLMTPDKLIKEHTLFPLFKPFLPSQAASKVMNLMKGAMRGAALHIIVGKTRRDMKPLQYLRYCPACAEEDEALHGESYWHRSHQMAGVCVCHRHAVSLVDSDVCSSFAANKKPFRLVDDAKPGRQSMKGKEKYFDHCLEIARDVNWLLHNDPPLRGPKAVKNAYLHQLTLRGLATCLGAVKYRRLRKAFSEFYENDFLEAIDCHVEWSSDWNWVRRILGRSKWETHPVRHALFRRFLGLENGEFWNQTTVRPFGEGPWPCLNPAASHHGEAVAELKEITRKRRKEGYVGYFVCQCGFAYTRGVSGAPDDDPYRIGRVVSYGTEWARLFVNLAQRGESVAEIARLLKIDRETVDRKIAIMATNDRERWYELLASNGREEKRLRCRKVVAGLRLSHPHLGRKALCSMASKEYGWLNKYDREWLSKELSVIPKKRFGGCADSIMRPDWEQRDRQWYENITSGIARLRRVPRRITATLIGRMFGGNDKFKGKLTKMPETQRVVSRIVETSDDFMLRKALCAVEDMRKEGQDVDLLDAVRRARVNRDCRMQVVERLGALYRKGAGLDSAWNIFFSERRGGTSP